LGYHCFNPVDAGQVHSRDALEFVAEINAGVF
jgi:hypothetical protein